jgi:hypothetical protein
MALGAVAPKAEAQGTEGMTERAVSSAARAGVGRSAALAPAPAIKRVVFLDANDPERMDAIANRLRKYGYQDLARMVGKLPRDSHPHRHFEAYEAIKALPAAVLDSLPLVPSNGANPRK